MMSAEKLTTLLTCLGKVASTAEDCTNWNQRNLETSQQNH